MGETDLQAGAFDELAGVLTRQPRSRPAAARLMASTSNGFSGTGVALVAWPLPLIISTRWRPCSPRSSMFAPTVSETRSPSSRSNRTSSASRGPSARAAWIRPRALLSQPRRRRLLGHLGPVGCLERVACDLTAVGRPPVVVRQARHSTRERRRRGCLAARPGAGGRSSQTVVRVAWNGRTPARSSHTNQSARSRAYASGCRGGCHNA